MPQSLINPQTFAAIKDLRLIAKAVVDGFLLGQNQSISRGAGIEFSQYRSYQPGDDLRQLDWKMFARSDRYYIRESEVDSNLAVRFIIDASGSMAHQDGLITKLNYACYLIAALAHLAVGQGDSVGLFVLQENQVQPLSPQNSAGHLQKLFLQLTQLQPNGHFPRIELLSPVLAKKSQKEITVFVTDLYEKSSEISEILFKIGAREKDTLLFHLIAKNEIELEFSGPIIFKELESENSITINTKKEKVEYLEKVKSWLFLVENDFRKRRIHYSRFNLHEPLDQALREFLIKRQRLL